MESFFFFLIIIIVLPVSFLIHSLHKLVWDLFKKPNQLKAGKTQLLLSLSTPHNHHLFLPSHPAVHGSTY